jgi:hypothetical protein
VLIYILLSRNNYRRAKLLRRKEISDEINSVERRLSEANSGASKSKKFRAFYGTRRFVIVFT